MSRYAIETLGRGLSVLSLFSRDASDLSLTEISKSADLNMTTSLRIASTLVEAGYLRRDPETKRYRPALKVLQLGFAALQSLDVRQVARPPLERLSQETGETVSHAVLDGLEIVYVDRIRNRQIVGVVLGLGSRLPAHCTSMGKAMLAFLSNEQLSKRLKRARLSACTANSITSVEDLQNDLVKVRERGYAINDQELAMGLRALAAPILGADGRAVAAVNVSGSTETISRSRVREELAPRLLEATAEISQVLGHMEGVPAAQ